MTDTSQRIIPPRLKGRLGYSEEHWRHYQAGARERAPAVFAFADQHASWPHPSVNATHCNPHVIRVSVQHGAIPAEAQNHALSTSLQTH